MKMFGIKTIVFSAMCLEAAAYELAVAHLSDEQAEYLDKQHNLKGKWVVVPQLICGQSLNEDGPALNSLQTLIKTRNDLVHSKSFLSNSEANSDDSAHKHKRAFSLQRVPEAFKTVVLLSLELNELFGEMAAILPPFEKGTTSSRETPDLIKKVIARCREVHRNYLTRRINGA